MTRLVAVLTAVALAAGSLDAQELRGSLTLGEGAAAAVGVIIEATDSATGATVARTLTTAQGTFALRLPGPRTVRVRALRIGNRPTPLGTFVLAAGETRNERFALTGETIVLDRISVVGAQTCELARGDVAAALTLFDEARKAITATQLTSGGARMTAEWTIESQITTLTGRPLGEAVARTLRAPTEQPFVSLSPDSLAKVGYVAPDGDSWVYQAPDARVLLSEQFTAEHCFRAEPWTKDSSDWVGLSFRPAERSTRGRVGIQGTMWLDRQSSELRLLEYTYHGLPRDLAGTPAGGDVSFLRLPSGAWLVSRWSIRMPKPTDYIDESVGSRGLTHRTRRITTMEVAAGTVTEVRRGSAVIFRAEPVTASASATSAEIAEMCMAGGVRQSVLWGRVKGNGGVGVSGVRLVATWREDLRWFSDLKNSWQDRQLATTSRPDGLWAFCDLPVGQLLQLKVDAEGRDGAVRFARIEAVDKPTELAVLLSRPPGRGVIEGTIGDSASAARWANVDVRLLGTSLVATTARDGSFRIRDVPAGKYTVVAVAHHTEFLGLSAPTAEVVVASEGSVASINLPIATAADRYRALCGGDPVDGIGVLFGEVRDATGARRRGIEVLGSWTRVTLARRTLERDVRSVSDTTGPDGRFALCGVPTGSEIGTAANTATTVQTGIVTLHATGPQLISGQVNLVPEGNVVSRRDLVVGLPTRTTRLAGRILDENGRPLQLATVSIVGRPGAVVQSNSLGEWRFEDTPIASTQIQIRALRYLPRTIDVEPTAGRLFVGEVRMARVPQQLQAVIVRGSAYDASKEGFEERRRGAVGVFLDEAWLRSAPTVSAERVRTMIPASRMGSHQTILLGSRLKIGFETSSTGGVDSVHKAGMTLCFPKWFVDGVEWGIPLANEEQMLLEEAVRIEVYKGPEAPARYLDGEGCGVVLIWTNP